MLPYITKLDEIFQSYNAICKLELMNTMSNIRQSTTIFYAIISGKYRKVWLIGQLNKTLVN